MLELSAYRLQERRSSAGTYDFVDPVNGRLVGTAHLEAAESSQRTWLDSWLEVLLRFRLFRVLGLVFASIGAVFWLMGAMLGAWPLHPQGSRPRLVIRRSDDEQVVFTLRQASGLMYDSRRVYDGQGRLIAQFRSHFKTTVRGGFAIIDLRGLDDDCGNIQERPWLGRVECAGDGYHLSLVSQRTAARITPHAAPANDGQDAQAQPKCYDIEGTPETSADTTRNILLLAAALTIAW